jgi:hypothetical protein
VTAPRPALYPRLNGQRAPCSARALPPPHRPSPLCTRARASRPPLNSVARRPASNAGRPALPDPRSALPVLYRAPRRAPTSYVDSNRPAEGAEWVELG